MSIKIYIYTLDKSYKTNFLYENPNKDAERHALLSDALRLYLSSGLPSGINMRKRYGKLESTDIELDLTLGEGEYGKPYFVSEELSKIHFSISHSGRYWAIAFSDSEVGFDIEDFTARKHDDRRYMKIAKRFFTDNETYFVEQSYAGKVRGLEARRRKLAEAEDKRLEKKGITKEISHFEFFRIWTRKEAYIKYVGSGLSHGLKTFSTMEQESPDSKAYYFDDIGIITLIATDEMVCSCCGDATYIQDNPTVEFVEMNELE